MRKSGTDLFVAPTLFIRLYVPADLHTNPPEHASVDVIGLRDSPSFSQL